MTRNSSLLTLRRVLITWLIVSILGNGMAVAADVHNELASDQTHTLDDHAANPGDTDNYDDCDHCCHGVTHLLGLNSATALSLTTNRGIILTPYSIFLASFSPHSPFRPPITS